VKFTDIRYLAGGAQQAEPVYFGCRNRRG
jgi:hypothetical protein